MNATIAKTLRKWTKLRSLDYKTVKALYNSLSPDKRMEMLKEARTYNKMVELKRIIPAPPRLVQE